MKVITLLNEKGGVGKTTLATHIAAGLAIKGHKVVLVDTDPQGNASSALGLSKAPAFYDLVVRDVEWRKILTVVHPDVYSSPDSQAQGQLYAVTSNNESRNVANSMKSRATIRRRFQELKNAIDFIIVDTSPTPSLLNESVLLATDHVLIPTDCEAFSALEAVPDSVSHANVAREATFEIGIDASNLLGIIPNKYRARTAGHNEVLKILHEQFGDYVWEPLHQFIAYSDVQLLQQFLFGIAPDSRATQQIWRVIERIEKVAVHE